MHLVQRKPARDPAGRCCRRSGLLASSFGAWDFGLVGDIIVGILGALVASRCFPRVGLHLGSGIGAEILAATSALCCSSL